MHIRPHIHFRPLVAVFLGLVIINFWWLASLNI